MLIHGVLGANKYLNPFYLTGILAGDEFTYGSTNMWSQDTIPTRIKIYLLPKKLNNNARK